MAASDEIEHSYRHCRQIVRQSGSNFSLAFLLLPREQRRAMYALYAFARQADDLADSPAPVEHRRRALQNFSDELEASLAGRPAGRLFPALADTQKRFDIPPRYLREIVQGVQMDLDHYGFETFDEAARYCYHVASAVGLACLHIWRSASDAAHRPAVDCGIAFQWTNILRDLHEDAQRDRLYLPRASLRQFGCNAEDLLDVAHRDRLVALIEFEAERATGYYRAAADLEAMLSGPPRRVFAMMFGRYADLHRQICREPKSVLSRKVRVGLLQKLGIGANAVLGRRVKRP